MRRFVIATALVAGALAPAAGASAANTPAPRPPSVGGLGIRLVDAPTSGRDDPRAHVYIVDHLAPGAVIHRRIEVSNGTGKAVQASVYPAAASVTGGSFLGLAGRARNELSTWTSVQPARTDLKPGAKRLVMVTIRIPKDAAPGEKYGVVWAEVRSAARAGANVTQVSRAGIRLYVSVGPGGAPAANFAVATLTAERSQSGEPVVVARVKNTGGRAIDMSGSLRLTGGPGGLSAGPFPAVLGTTLAPGQSEPVRVILDRQLPAGPWQARISLRSGLVQRTATARITFPAKGSAAPVAATTAKPGRNWAMPAVAGAVLGLGLLAGAVLVRRRRRTAPRTSAPDRELTPTG